MSPTHDSALEQKSINVQFMNEKVHPENFPSVFSDSSRLSLQTSISSSGSSSSGRPTSHHRRRSSVSTRRDSAEMMGVPFSAAVAPDSTAVEENDTDGFRRRTLLALEGGSALTSMDSTSSSSLVVNGFSRVEIPELDFERIDKVASQSGRNIFHSSNSVLPNKRDSHSRTSIVSKDVQLHTLVEVDEDEDEDCKSVCQIDPPKCSDVSDLGISSPDSSQTNVPLNRPGLKRLTLTTCLQRPTHQSSVTRSAQMTADVSFRKSSLSYRHSSEVNSPTFSQSLTLPVDALPTPELTPVITERPLSPSEQAFLNNNHSSLLARISELERVLLVRTRNRSVSTATTSSRQLSISSVVSDSPSDEMLCLVRDLKAERDDLSRDVGVWESRVADLETQVDLLTRRVENERRDAWQAREKIKTLETENRRLQDDLNKSFIEHTTLQNALTTATTVHQECDSRLQLEKNLRIEAESSLARSELRNQGLVFEAADGGRLRLDGDHTVSSAVGISASLKENNRRRRDSPLSDAEDELAHYEDEDDEDVAAYSDDSYSDRAIPSSFTGPEIRLDGIQLNSVLASQFNHDLSPSSGLSLTPPPTPLFNSTMTHQRKSSLEPGWSFPIGAHAVIREKEIADPFFDCLSTVDIVPTTTDMPGITQPNRDKYFFFKAANDDTDDGFTPFVIPSATSEKGSYPTVDDDRIPGLPRDESNILTISKFFDSTQHPSVCGRDGRDVIVTLQQSRSQHDRNIEHGVLERSGLPDVEHVIPSQCITPTMRKAIPSSIPKFTSTPSSPLKSYVQPATPTSIPRMKTAGASGMKSPIRPAMRPVEEHIVTHQALRRIEVNGSPLSRSSAQVKSIPSVKPSSTGITSLASYLPWSNWTSVENSSSSDASPAPNFRMKYGKLRATERTNKATAKLVPLKKSNGVSNSNRADGLSLL